MRFDSCKYSVNFRMEITQSNSSGSQINNELAVALVSS